MTTTYEFLQAMYYNPEQELAIRAYYDKKEQSHNPDSKFTAKMFKFKLKEYPKWEKHLISRNKDGQGVHFSINCSHSMDNCQYAYAQFFEIDDKSFEEQMRIIKTKSKAAPSAIVKTRKSYHVYYFLNYGDIKRFREIQQRLALYFGADAQKCPESTCMRLPGFYHQKKEPLMVDVVEFNPYNRYSQDELAAWLPELPKEEPKKKTFHDLGPLEFSNDFNENVWNMMYWKVRDYIAFERSDKLLLHCILPSHGDRNASAVLFKAKNNYFCSGCGQRLSAKELCEVMGWRDILDYMDNYFKEQYKEKLKEAQKK